MIEVEVSGPRFKKRQGFMFSESDRVGDCARRAAVTRLYSDLGQYTFALDGSILKQGNQVGSVLFDKARVELVLL